MSDLGTRIHALVEWTAPPIDGYDITRGRAPRPARWVPILAAFVAVLVIGGFTFVFGGWQPGDPVADAASIPVDVTDPVVGSTSPDTTLSQTVPWSLSVVRVDCTAELEAFPCSALVDRDSTTEWQTRSIAAASFRFYFAAPASIERIGFANIPDETRFLRNGRVRLVQIVSSDGRSDIVELMDSNDATQWVEFQTTGLATEWVEMTITAAYPGVRVGDLEPFGEVALADVVFEGYGAGTDFLGLVYESLDGVAPDAATVAAFGLEFCGGGGPIDALVFGVARAYCRPNNDHNGGFTMRTYVTQDYPASFPAGTTVDASDPPSDWSTRALADGSIAYIGESISEWGEIEGLGTVPLTDSNVSWHVIIVKPEGLLVHLNAHMVGSDPPPTGITDLESLLTIADSISIEFPLPTP